MSHRRQDVKWSKYWSLPTMDVISPRLAICPRPKPFIDKSEEEAAQGSYPSNQQSHVPRAIHHPREARITSLKLSIFYATPPSPSRAHAALIGQPHLAAPSGTLGCLAAERVGPAATQLQSPIHLEPQSLHDPGQAMHCPAHKLALQLRSLPAVALPCTDTPHVSHLNGTSTFA